MNKSYPVQVGSVAFIRVNDEPVFVVDSPDGDDEQFKCRRFRTNGDQDTIVVFAGELVSPQQKIVDELDLQMFAFRLKAEYQKEWDKEQKRNKALVMPEPAIPNSGGEGGYGGGLAN